MKNYLKNESYMIEASKPKSKSTKKSYLLLIKKTKNNNDNVWGCWHYESPKKKFYKKIEEPCEYRNYKEALFLAIENKSTFSQLSIPAPILTTMTKSEPVISTLEKKTSRGPMVNYFAVENTKLDNSGVMSLVRVCHLWPSVLRAETPS